MKFECKTIKDFFDVIPGTGVSELEYEKGKVPYISESAKDNGVRFYINPKQIFKNLNIQKKCLSMSSKTGACFYHPYTCVIGQQTHALKLISENKYKNLDLVYLYFATLIEKQTKKKASFGYQLSSTKLPYVKILVPMEAGRLCTEYICSFMSKAYADFKKLDINNSPISTANIGTNWELKALGELFTEEELHSAVCIDENKISKKLRNGDIPYVTRTAQNNGIKTFYKESEELTINHGNCLCIGLDTQTCFYQPRDFYCGQNILVIEKNGMDKYAWIFMAAIIQNAISKYSWGSTGATLGRLRRTKLMVPIKNSKLDCEYMEKYIKSSPFSINL